MRTIRLVCLCAAVAFVSACAQSDAETVVTDATANVSTTLADTSTTVAAGDFGSRYVGSPVAFWFWAPY